jgi:protein involved in polysaccharide export with SLBB domain
MSIRDLIFAADSLKRSTFAEHGTLFRTLSNLRKEILGFSPRLALLGDERENLLLMNEDSLVVYPDSQFSPVRMVTVQGAVRRPGTYPRNENMAVSDLLVLAGGLLEGGSTRNLEVSRLDTLELGVYRKIFKVSLGQEYWDSNSSGRFLLDDFDVVFVPSDPRWSAHKTVKLSGYVMYPGAYTIQFEGEKLADMFRRAGGFRSGAYLEGSHLIRKFNNAGLVPIDFRNVITDSLSRDNVVIYDGDSVYVAFSEDVVYVSGEVYVPSPVLYKAGARLSYYIEQAGDYKQEAEASKTVVFLPGGKKWDGGDILPGSTIFVPRKIEKEDKTLQTVASLATVLASLAAITVALIQVKR